MIEYINEKKKKKSGKKSLDNMIQLNSHFFIFCNICQSIYAIMKSTFTTLLNIKDSIIDFFLNHEIKKKNFF